MQNVHGLFVVVTVQSRFATTNSTIVTGVVLFVNCFFFIVRRLDQLDVGGLYYTIGIANLKCVFYLPIQLGDVLVALPLFVLYELSFWQSGISEFVLLYDGPLPRNCEFEICTTARMFLNTSLLVSRSLLWYHAVLQERVLCLITSLVVAVDITCDGCWVKKCIINRRT